MYLDLGISGGVYHVVSELQCAGFETYIVGGAIRDLIFGTAPKDYDISTSATPEEVREVFGRKHARIIGRRFRLVHVTVGKELFEVSTFRKCPSLHAGQVQGEKFSDMPEKMIVSDNSYGTSQEDAFRRDFTVNALFYDPVKKDLIDHTGMGLSDINKGIVRAIGNADLRFEEDPVRMLRALKLVAQFDFSLEQDTENALFRNLHLFCCASSGRLSLELEKILRSAYSDRHFEVFFAYGLLNYFLPKLAEKWGSAACEEALQMLYERNCRVADGSYRESLSLALAALTLPFAAAELGGNSAELPPWDRDRSAEVMENFIVQMIAPQTMMIKVREFALRIMQLQTLLETSDDDRLQTLIGQRAYPHARELIIIRAKAFGTHDVGEIMRRYPPAQPHVRKLSSDARKKKNLKNNWLQKRKFMKKNKQQDDRIIDGELS